MAIAFADLLTPTPLATIKNTIVTTAKVLGLPTDSWAENGITRTTIALFAKLYSTATDLIAVVAGSGFLDTASGDWLTLLAKSVYGVDRIEASYASGVQALTLTNGGGGLYTFAVGDVVAVNTATGATYRNTSGGTLSPGAGQTLKLDIQAEVGGSTGNAGVGEIDDLVTKFLGVTCANTIALAAADAESDENLRTRCRDSVALKSPGGTRKAYEYVARSAVDASGNSLGVTRVQVMPAPGDGTVVIYVAKDTGAIGSTALAIVQADFDDKVTPYGFAATATDATNHTITAPCSIWIPTSLGMSDADAKKAVDDALKAYVNTIPIGGTVLPPATGKVYWRALLGVIERAIPGMLHATLASESDVAISDGQAPVWAGSTADITVTQVSS